MSLGLGFKALIVSIFGALLLGASIFWNAYDASASNKASIGAASRQMAYFRKILFSPGDNGDSHASVDCVGCHTPFRQLTDEKCKKCHTQDFFNYTNSGATLESHLALIKSGRGYCLYCHSGHGRSSSKGIAGLKEIGHDASRNKILGCELCHRAGHENMTNKKCEGCHTRDSWADATFSHRDLDELSIFLRLSNEAKETRYESVCGKCHIEGWHVLGDSKGEVGGSDKPECLVCHTGSRAR